jgi:DNA-binding transcriptional regulator YiaG
MKSARVWTPESMKALRESLGETQDEFRGRLRVPLPTLRNWEQNNSRIPGPVTVILDQLQQDLDAGLIGKAVPA